MWNGTSGSYGGVRSELRRTRLVAHIHGGGDERDLLLPVIDESCGTECLVGNDDHGITNDG